MIKKIKDDSVGENYGKGYICIMLEEGYLVFLL